MDPLGDLPLEALAATVVDMCEIPFTAIGVSIEPGMMTLARRPYFALLMASV